MNHHRPAPDCTCMECVMERIGPFTYKRPGRGGRHRIEIADVRRVIERYGTQGRAARALGVSRMTIQRRIKEACST